MPLENYKKEELKKIVKLYNMGLEEKELKQKKSDLIKTMKGVKEDYDYDEIDKSLKKKETTTVDKKEKKKITIYPKKKKAEEKKKLIIKPKKAAGKKKKAIKQIKGQSKISDYTEKQ
tara:strand:+ start:538 stop:888 length:351 start_codon:yes stop_codon:yes gene_type:complete